MTVDAAGADTSCGRSPRSAVKPLAVSRSPWHVSQQALNVNENANILFLLAPWKLWLCPFLFRILKLLFYPFCISLSDALD